METKHTPGPWDLFLDEDKFQIINKEKEYIASTNSIRGDEGGYIENGNAQLIAAAPDLAEALRNAIYILKMKYKKLELDPSGPVWDQMYNALNKAGINL